jgi:hypothetical protein
MSKTSRRFHDMTIILQYGTNSAFLLPFRGLEENSIAIFQSRWRRGSSHPTSVIGGLNQRDEDETGLEVGCTRHGVNGVGLCCNVDAGVGR